jgi:hypothetical protein
MYLRYCCERNGSPRLMPLHPDAPLVGKNQKTARNGQICGCEETPEVDGDQGSSGPPELISSCATAQAWTSETAAISNAAEMNRKVNKLGGSACTHWTPPCSRAIFGSGIVCIRVRMRSRCARNSATPRVESWEYGLSKEARDSGRSAGRLSFEETRSPREFHFLVGGSMQRRRSRISRPCPATRVGPVLARDFEDTRPLPLRGLAIRPSPLRPFRRRFRFCGESDKLRDCSWNY